MQGEGPDSTDHPRPAGASGTVANEDFEIEVIDPVKQGDGVGVRVKLFSLTGMRVTDPLG